MYLWIRKASNPLCAAELGQLVTSPSQNQSSAGKCIYWCMGLCQSTL